MAHCFPPKVPRIAPAALALMLIASACATGGSPQPAPPPVSAAGPRVAATAQSEWRDCLRFSREWEQASRLSPTPSLSARSVALGPTCLQAR